ncbi:MAG: hypothetical protein IKC15_00655 [Kiritimatiellae bacterium]|nr:hypothetical protein [Kiritimatiellia bacterium]
MIKKMMAMLVAISCAFGAWADTHISGTDFSALNVGSFVLGLDDEGNDTGTNYWYNGDTSDFEGTIVTDGVGKFLDFESNITNPLYRTVNDCYGAESVSALPKRLIGAGLFIDTYVQFTPYLVNENHPAPSAVTDDDKLIVWVREIEVENDANLTNLIVTAGYYNDFDEVSASNYVVSSLSPAQVSELCSATNRLTVKSFSSITGEADAPAGFVVYLNKVALEYTADAFGASGSYAGNLDTTPAAYYETGHHKLFPSLMAGDQTNHDKLSGVGYAGMGKIGEVWFDDYTTDYPDFAGDDHNITIVKGEGVVSYVYNNITYTEDYSTAVSVPTVTISNVVYATGYKHKTGTWYIGSQVVNNTSATGGDIGTFDLANGNRLVLAGFKANYLVGGVEYQSLFGIEPTETTGAYNAAKSGGTIKLNNDILIDEGTHKQIYVGEDDDLTIDLNGHTLRGTTEEDYTIVNNLGTLTIIDTSVGQTGKVLGCLTFDGVDWVNNFLAIKSTGEYVVSNALTAGTYELILTDVNADKFVISAGSYICPVEGEDNIQPSAFYLASYLAPGATVTSWTQDPETEFWYAIVGGSAPTTYAVTFSTNSVTVAEYTTNITAGATLPDGAIPAFTGGAWDVDPTNAVINAATNFNYTIEADPWAPTVETDEAAAAKIADLFPGTEVAANVTTYAMYTNLVDYIKGVTSQSEVPGDITDAQEPWLWKSFILGANPLFVTNAVVTITDVNAAATAGEWDFIVKVTEGELTTAHSVAAAKVAALVKVTDSLSPASWSAPDPEDVHADLAPLLGTNLIKVTVDFGTDTSGFMKVSE